MKESLENLCYQKEALSQVIKKLLRVKKCKVIECQHQHKIVKQKDGEGFKTKAKNKRNTKQNLTRNK